MGSSSLLCADDAFKVAGFAEGVEHGDPVFKLVKKLCVLAPVFLRSLFDVLWKKDVFEVKSPLFICFRRRRNR